MFFMTQKNLNLKLGYRLTITSYHPTKATEEKCTKEWLKQEIHKCKEAKLAENCWSVSKPNALLSTTYSAGAHLIQCCAPIQQPR